MYDKQKTWVRVMAIILAGMMVIGILQHILMLLVLARIFYPFLDIS